ncbi:unnamed protein product [Didymodactylos carnosus]|uniref:Octanoyl-[acyl-carrier-protein]:protein N-octanoyltransferase LIPT2, mitochondrial n=1 Tax=Didymodactylos carnosus TaxID=1234261 RepID=A0A8S2V585_9BILA|nr:unnamed protein product [Didymodactylos carnosus]CAF4378495.1 unnamed protein product [Didymodactylos carnosus]
MSRNVVEIVRCGRIPYAHGQLIQQRFIQKLLLHTTQPGYLLLSEFYPVYTCGIRRSSIIEKDIQRLQNLGAHFYQTNRGGLLTYHGFGQLVAYPILNLKLLKINLRSYIEYLEKILVATCQQYFDKSEAIIHAGTQSNSINYAGAWINDRKVAFIGVHYSRSITSHGISINCNPDMKWFEHIIPCGIIDKEMTSLSKELNRNVTIKEVTKQFLPCFERIFNVNLCENKEDEFVKENILTL